MDTGIAIFISALTATAGWLYSGHLNRVMDRRQHTYRIVIRQKDDEKFAAALRRVRALIKANDFPKSQDDDGRIDDVASIEYLLNHYEFLCAAICAGDVDENLVRACDETRIKRLCNKMADYIEVCRKDQPTAFEHVEFMATRWRADDRTRASKCYEFFFLKPCRKVTLWDRGYAWALSRGAVACQRGKVIWVRGRQRLRR